MHLHGRWDMCAYYCCESETNESCTPLTALKATSACGQPFVLMELCLRKGIIAYIPVRLDKLNPAAWTV